jgi:hypothetical protein
MMLATRLICSSSQKDLAENTQQQVRVVKLLVLGKTHTNVQQKKIRKGFNL